MIVQSIISTALASILRSRGDRFILLQKDISDINLGLDILIDDTGYNLELIKRPKNKIQEIFSYHAHFSIFDNISHFAVSRDYCAVLSGRDIVFWDCKKQQKCMTILNDSEFRWAKFHAESNTLFTISADNRLQLWHPNKYKQIGEMSLGKGIISNIDMSSCGNWFAFHRSDIWNIELWNVNDKKRTCFWKLHRPDLRNLLFNSGNEQELFLVYKHSLFEFRDAITGKLQIHHNTDVAIKAAAISPCGSYYAIADFNEVSYNKITLYHRDRESPLATFKLDDTVCSIAFSPCSEYLLAGDVNREAKIWRIKDQSCVARILVSTQTNHVAYLLGSSDWVFTVDSNSVKLWDVSRHK